MANTSKELTEEQCQWALKKWYDALILSSSQIQDTCQIQKQIRVLLDLMDEHDTISISPKDLGQLRHLQDAPDRVFNAIASQVAEKRGDTLDYFRSAVQTVLGAPEKNLLSEWLRRARKKCETAPPKLLLGNERKALNHADSVPDVVKCPNCNHVMIEPVLLRCLHSCCLGCFKKADNVCRICEVKHHGISGRNFVIARHMKYWGIRIASEKCIKCQQVEESSTNTMRPQKASHFCSKCNAFVCPKHLCKGHENAPAEEYLESKKKELYKLTCETHERDMTFYCKGCKALHCVDYQISHGGQHNVLSFSSFTPEAGHSIKTYLDDRRSTAVSEAPLVGSLRSDLQTLYESILDDSLKCAMNATEVACEKANPNITQDCTSLAKYFKALLYGIDRAIIYLDFLVSSNDAWFAEQWSVVDQQRLLVHNPGFEDSDVTQDSTRTRSPSSSQLAGPANDNDNLFERLHCVDSSSESSTAFIKEPVGMPTKKNAGALQEESKSALYLKSEVDVVTSYRTQLEEKEAKVCALESEIKRLQNELRSRCACFTSAPSTLSNVQGATSMSKVQDFSDPKGFEVSRPERMAVASSSSQVNGDNHNNTVVTSSDSIDAEQFTGTNEGMSKLWRDNWLNLTNMSSLNTKHIAGYMFSKQQLNLCEWRKVMETRDSAESVNLLFKFIVLRPGREIIEHFKDALKNYELTHLIKKGS